MEVDKEPLGKLWGLLEDARTAAQDAFYAKTAQAQRGHLEETIRLAREALKVIDELEGALP